MQTGVGGAQKTGTVAAPVFPHISRARRAVPEGQLRQVTERVSCPPTSKPSPGSSGPPAGSPPGVGEGADGLRNFAGLTCSACSLPQRA